MVKKAEKLLAITAGMALFSMMLLTFVDVVGRYGFNRSIFGTAELIEFLMVFAIFAGMAIISVSNEHITVTIFEGWITKHIPNLQRWTVHVFTLIVYAGISYQLWVRCIDSFAEDKRTPVLDAPQWIMPASAAILSTLGVVLFFFALVRSKGRMVTMLESPHINNGAD